MAYFGVIESILELDYSGLRFPVFKCQWVNNSGGRRIDEFGFVSVDLSKTGYKDDPYILSSLVTRVSIHISLRNNSPLPYPIDGMNVVVDAIGYVEVLSSTCALSACRCTCA